MAAGDWDRLPDAVLVTDGTDRLVEWNEAARRLLRLREGQRGTPLAAAVAWEGTDVPRAEALRLAAERGTWRGAVRLSGIPGTESFCDWTIAVERDAGGHPVGTVECVRSLLLPAAETAEEERFLRAELDLSLALNRAATLPQALEACLGTALAVAGMDSGGVYRVTEEGSLVLLVHRGLASPFVEGVRRIEASDWRAEVALRGEPRFAEEGEFGSRVYGLDREEGLRSLAVMPVLHEGRPVACLAVASHASGRIPPSARRALREIASRAGMSIARLRIEELLRESEERFRSIAEQLPDVLFLTDKRGTITYLSPAAGRFFGWAAEQMTGRPFTDYLTDADVPLALDRFRKDVVEGRGTENLPLEMRRKDGGLFQGELSASPLRHRDDVVGTIGIIRDVTAGRLNEARLAGLLELASMAGKPEKDLTDAALEKAIHLTGSRIGYLAFLDEAEKVLTMYSWSKEAMRECAVAEKPVVYPVEKTGLWGEAVRRRRPVVTNDYAADNPGKRGLPEGHVGLRRHMNVPLFDGDRIVLLAGVGNKADPYGEDDVRQVTLVMDGLWKILKAGRAEKALRESEARYRFLVQYSIDVFAMLDARGTIRFISPSIERITGYPPAELEGKDSFAMVHPEDADRVRDAFRTGIGVPGREVRLECRYRHKDGSWVHIESSGVNLLHEPSVGAVLITTRDVTERLRAEAERALLREQLQQAMKMEAVGRLAGGVAHDFNNLLTSISGNVSMLQMDLEPGDPRAETLGEIGHAAESAASLTRRLLAFSRKQIVEPKPVRLDALIEDMSRMLVRLIGEHIELRTLPAPEPAGVLIDPGELEQILVNLAVNARDAMPDGGTLTIATANVALDEAASLVHPGVRAGPFVRLSVLDTGHGMDGEVKKHLFEPFFTTKPKDRGTGLGLATIYGAVLRAGGAVEVESEVGRGTAFRIYLPRVDLPEEPAAPAPREAEPGGRETILLVEDDGTLRKLASRMLQRLGYEVLEASQGADALPLAQGRGEPIDLLLTDVVLPGMNGRELADRLTAVHPEMEILFMSGYTDDVILHTGVRERNLHFLGKPFSLQSLSRKLREVLDGRR